MANQDEARLSTLWLESSNTDTKEDTAIPIMAPQREPDNADTQKDIVTPDKPVRRGPPNRMNDLAYKDWMKFQKSFFRHTSHLDLVRECITFFTKAKWPDGKCSRTLLLGFPIDVKDLSLGERQIESESFANSHDLFGRLESLEKENRKYDFILVNLVPLFHTSIETITFLETWADKYFSLIRSISYPGKYCGMIVGTPAAGGGGLPVPWFVGLAGRDHLRLRDEKIGLMEAENRVYYCLFLQSIDDARPSARLDAASLHISHEDHQITPWVMPKSPPRRKNEILHPAKFPESLVEEFICNFTKPGDNVLDPMVGTGSTVLAAVKAGRNGFGVDLNQDFVNISMSRLAHAHSPSLFEETDLRVKGTFFYGDATQLDKIAEIQEIKFAYCITSPPYWSMLSNPGSENQRARRERNLPLTYSDNAHDLGNIKSYDEFLHQLKIVYNQVAQKLSPGGYLTVVVKNIKREHILYPLAWDLLLLLCDSEGPYDYVGTTLWCQDDVGIKPFAVGIHWVSNILHHYCLHFRLRDKA